MTDKLSPSSLTSGTLSINPLFPYYGQDNPSQGFRDNFRNTLGGLASAYTAINSLIDNEIVKGVEGDTSMDHGTVKEVILNDWSQTRMNHINSGTAITLDYSVAAVHSIASSSARSAATVYLRNFPVDGSLATMRLYVEVPSTSFKLNWSDAAYIANAASIGGYAAATGVMSFLSTGTYGLEISSYTGDSFYIHDLDNRASGPNGGGVAASRTTVSTSTGILQAGNTANLTLPGYRGYILYKATVSAPAWVRLYTSSDARSADLLSGRSQTTDPTTPGVVAEFITGTDNETVVVAPAIMGFNDDPVPVAEIPIAVTNIGTVQKIIQVSTVIVQTEI